MMLKGYQQETLEALRRFRKNGGVNREHIAALKRRKVII